MRCHIIIIISIVVFILIVACVQYKTQPTYQETFDSVGSRELTPLNHNGLKLWTFLNSFKNESLWKAGKPADWKTGKVVKNQYKESEPQNKSHAGEFVAAVLDTGNYPILAPNTPLLANAQGNWLKSLDATGYGWRRLQSPVEAQNAANTGHVVIASYVNPDASKSGHITIVKPSTVQTTTAVNTFGPTVVNPGTTTTPASKSATTKYVFRDFTQNWKHDVMFHMHKKTFNKQN